MRRGPLVLVALLLAGAPHVTPGAEAVQTLTVLWEDTRGQTSSWWDHATIVLPDTTRAHSIGFERRACFADVHGAMVFDDWAATTPVGTFTHRSLQYIAGHATGVRIAVDAADLDIQQGTETTPDGICAWHRAYMPFQHPIQVDAFRFTVAYRHATSTYAKAWIVATDTVTPTSTALRGGDRTFLVTEHDLETGDEVRAVASVRADARTVVPFTVGPTALLSWHTDVGSIGLTDPEGRRCRLDDAVVRLRSSGCAHFEDGNGAGDWHVHMPYDAGLGRGRFVWGGVDADRFA